MRKLKPPSEGWDLLRDGISASLLMKFIGCKERFRLRAIEGLVEKRDEDHLNYGIIFHKIVQLHDERKGRPESSWIRNDILRWVEQKFNTASIESLRTMARVALAQHDQYRKWEQDKGRYRSISQEEVFNEPFTLPPARIETDEIKVNIPSVKIPLRGRIDSIVENEDGIWVQDMKTKGRVVPSYIMDTLPENLQMMFYSLCAGLKYRKRVAGIIYNVVRRPGQRRRKNEPAHEYIDRIVEDIKKEPDYYFYRFIYKFRDGDLEKWKKEVFIPALYQVYIWWRSISKNPTDPWQGEDGSVNPFHGRRPFGVIDSMTIGKGDYYDLIVHGRKVGLEYNPDVFPELEEDEDEF